MQWIRKGEQWQPVKFAVKNGEGQPLVGYGIAELVKSDQRNLSSSLRLLLSQNAGGCATAEVKQLLNQR